MPQPIDGQPISSDPGPDVEAERTRIFNEILDSLEGDIDDIISKASGGGESDE